MSNITGNQWTITKRPHTFNDLYKCDQIKKYFYGLVSKKKDFPNAVLFQGKYGCGKTTSAKILAQMMVCQNPHENGDPCCECPSCRAIIDETFNRDVMQIDGGQAGKDEIIETVNNFSSLPPFKDKKKVIIIEEIQELSTKAKNSLLKTLEMPKKNVHFIFTSMENMASSGLTSRCEVFKFKPATTLEIMYYLKEIMDKEIVDGVSLWDRQDISMEFKTEGLKAIADSCDGSYRAALQQLEQCIDSGLFDISSLQKEIGIASQQTFINCLDDMLNGNPSERLFNTLVEGDYNANFNLMFKVITEAETYRIFKALPYGDNEYFVKQAAAYAAHKNFIKVKDAFYKFAVENKDYIKKNCYYMFVCSIIDMCKPETTVRRRIES